MNLRASAVVLIPLTVALIPLFTAIPVSAQYGGLEVNYGSWWRGERARIATASLYQPLGMGVSWGVGAVHIDDRGNVDDRTATGAEVTLALGRRGSGVHFIGSGGLVRLQQTGDINAIWSVGAGYSVSPASFLTFGVDARYRLEDRNLSGFWRRQLDDRAGLALQVGITLGGGRRHASPRPAGGVGGGNRGETVRTGNTPPSGDEIYETARARGASRDNAELAQSIVETAIDVMGTPYNWGGSDSNGFDCSGLIKYAYEQHGIIIPRVSRDQARAGRPVPARISELMPGDILGFSIEGNRVTHVGLYVGNGQFIHSSSGGVTLSSLVGSDGESNWWTTRWIASRRILN